MAEFLIKAIDATHSDPEKDKRGCYKRGDFVVVMPDGHEWGKEERLPKFVVVKIPGLSVETAKKYILSHDEPRPATRTWNKLDWDEALVSGEYQEFLSQPSEIGQSTSQETVRVSAEKWIEMKETNDYSPFSSKPTITKTLIGGVELTGAVELVTLEGTAMTTITRRKWRILVDNVPRSIKDTLALDGEVTVTWEQVRNFVKNKLTGLTE
jgi:hypothetical protein